MSTISRNSDVTWIGVSENPLRSIPETLMLFGLAFREIHFVPFPKQQILTLAKILNISEYQKRIPKFTEFFSKLINLCQAESELYHALKNLIIPSENDSQKTWQIFAGKLREIMQIHRDIGHEWHFIDEQFEYLTHYFYANTLLIERLNLAVSDREGIENSLLLPP